MKCYKIKHIPTGLYVAGNTWTNNSLGKIWNRFNHVQSHIKQYSKNSLGIYKDGNYELIEYEMKEIGTKPI